MESGKWTVVSGKWKVDSGQWPVDSGQWTVDGQWGVISLISAWRTELFVKM